MIRGHVLARATAILNEGEPAEREARLHDLDLTDEEKVRLIAMVTEASMSVLVELGALVPVRERTLLEMDYAEIRQTGARLYGQGIALGWLADQLAPSWAARTTASLGDVLKTQWSNRVAHLKDELGKVGLSLGDDDDHVPDA